MTTDINGWPVQYQTTKVRVEGYEYVVRSLGFDKNNPNTVYRRHGPNGEIETITPKDWPEDSKHENGSYTNKCLGCEEFFNGHKDRRVCRVCALEKSVWVADLTDEEKLAELKRFN